MKNVVKSFLALTLLICSVLAVQAQDNKANRPSPPAEAKGKIGDADIMIAYSSPGVNGRKIWGSLVPYNQVWRTGANEATTFETSTDITVNGSKLPAGKYSLFTIPGEKSWTVIFNSVPNQWGSYQYDQEKDVLRVEAVPTTNEFQERMHFNIVDSQVVLTWENLKLALDIR
jgi:hypothetical protein